MKKDWKALRKIVPYRKDPYKNGKNIEIIKILDNKNKKKEDQKEIKNFIEKFDRIFLKHQIVYYTFKHYFKKTTTYWELK